MRKRSPYNSYLIAAIEIGHLGDQGVQLRWLLGQYLHPEMLRMFNSRHVRWAVNTGRYSSARLRINTFLFLTGSSVICHVQRKHINGNDNATIRQVRDLKSALAQNAIYAVYDTVFPEERLGNLP